MEPELATWQQVQGSIVTGGGQLTVHSSLDKDFVMSDLPHFLLQNNLSHDTFRRWIDADRRSFSIIGCWCRPIFAGGWAESSLHDTEAYNLQTPSLFIDMRFPLKRPSDRLKELGPLENYSTLDLRILARQHCFSGYSLPESMSSEQYTLSQSKYPVFTRHHIIDWNLHPTFPRNRPNRWWVEVNDAGEGSGSFKEHSIIRNKDTNLPVYFERWERIPPYPHQREKYFAARKILRQGRRERDCVLIVTGNHFALVVDRDTVAATTLSKSNTNSGDEMKHLQRHCGGGGAAYVEYLLNPAIHDAQALMENTKKARAYLDLEGSYGLVVRPTSSKEGVSPVALQVGFWTVVRSTHPWKENQSIFGEFDFVRFTCGNKKPVKFLWTTAQGSQPRDLGNQSSHRYGEWEILECSFTMSELAQVFPTADRIGVPSYVSLYSRL